VRKARLPSNDSTVRTESPPDRRPYPNTEANQMLADRLATCSRMHRPIDQSSLTASVNAVVLRVPGTFAGSLFNALPI
jgi:hypothetical protein